MTQEEKLEKAVKLADAMYNRMQNLTTDTSGIRKAMDEYHQFIINEYYKEDTEKDFGIKSNDLEEAAYQYGNCFDNHFELASMSFIKGAKWQKKHLEENRIKHCDNITYEAAVLCALRRKLIRCGDN